MLSNTNVRLLSLVGVLLLLVVAVICHAQQTDESSSALERTPKRKDNRTLNKRYLCPAIYFEPKLLKYHEYLGGDKNMEISKENCAYCCKKFVYKHAYLATHEGRKYCKCTDVRQTKWFGKLSNIDWAL